MNKIPFALGEAAQVAVLAPNADSTYANAAGGMSVFAGLVLAKRGKPLSVLHLTKETYLDVLGAAIQPHEGFAFEPIRHVAQALNGGNGVVVRVVPKDMRIPVLKLVKQASSTGVGAATISASNSTLTLSPSIVPADGINAANIQFIARDANGNVITNLRSNLSFTVSPSTGTVLTSIIESNGVYSATLTSTNSGSVNIRVNQSGNPVAGLAASVKFEPAVIDAAHSSFTASSDSITADGVSSTILTLQARDNNNMPITNIAALLDFSVSGLMQTTVGQINQGAPGVYSAILTGRNPGTATVIVRHNNADITALTKDIEVKTVQTVVSRVPYPDNCDLVVSSHASEADGLTPITVVLTLKDQNKQPITKAAPALRLEVTGISDFTPTSIIETQGVPGEYTMLLYAKLPGTAIITPWFQNQPIGNKHESIVFTAPTSLTPDQNRSRVFPSPASLAGDGVSTAAITFEAYSAGNLPIKNLAKVEFLIGNVKYPATNNGDGSYSATYSAQNTTGNDQPMNIAVLINDTQFAGVTGSIRVTSSKALLTPDATYSVFEPLKGAVQLPQTGSQSVPVTLHVKDANNQPISGIASDLVFTVQGTGNVHASIVTETTKGDYVATIENDTEEQVTIGIEYAGQAIANLTFVVPFSKTDNVIDGGQSTFKVTGSPTAADGVAKVTLSLIARNGKGNILHGVQGIRFVESTGSTGVFTGLVVEDTNNPGTYTVDVAADLQGKYSFAVLQGNANITNLAPVNVEFTASEISIADFKSYIDCDEVYVQPDVAVTVSLYAYDYQGQPIVGLKGLSLVDKKALADTQIGGFVDMTGGLYQAVVSGKTAGDMELQVQINNVDTALFEVLDITIEPATVIVPPAKTQKIDTSKSSLVFGAAGVAADGNAKASFTIELVGDDGKPYNPTGVIDLELSNTAGVQVDSLVPDATTVGKYTGTVSSHTVGKITFTVKEGSTDTVIKAEYEFVQPAGTQPNPGTATAPNGSKSTLEVSPASVVANDTDTITVTFHAKKADGTPLKGLAPDLGIQGFGAVGASGITATPFVESTTTDGDYTLTLKSSKAADLILTLTHKSKIISGQIATAAFTAVPGVYTAANSTFASSVSDIAADGTDTATLTFTAKDQNNKPLDGLTVEFEAAPNANVTIGTVNGTNGVYVATVTGKAFGDVQITAKVNNADSTKSAVTLHVTKHVDPSKTNIISSLSGTDVTTLTEHDFSFAFKLSDAKNVSIDDLESDLELDNPPAAITGSITFNSPTYVATLKATASVEWTPSIKRKSNGAVVLTSAHKLKFIAAVDPATTTITLENVGKIAKDGVLAKVADLTVTPKTPGETYTKEQIAFTGDAVSNRVVNIEITDGGAANQFIVKASSTTNGTYDLQLTVADVEIAGKTLSMEVADTASDEEDADFETVVPVMQSRSAYAGANELPHAPGGAAATYAAPAPVAANSVVTGRAITPVVGRAIASTTLRLEATTISVGDEVQLGNDDVLAIYVDDGDASGDRTLSITPHPDDADLWYITLNQVNVNGDVKVLERSVFTLTPDAIDDMGLPSYLPVMLENSESRLRAVVKSNAEFPLAYNGFTNEFFVGGNDGDLSKLTPDDYRDALNTLAASMVNYTAVCSLGVYDPIVLQHLALHSQEVRVDMFCDVRPAVAGAMAPTEAAAQGLGSFSHVARYHFPYSSRDPLTRAQVVYGLSGDAFTAKAKGVAMKPDVGGWHYAPAGYTRGVLQRANVLPLPGAASINRESYVTARINPVTVASDGSIVIDDSLTTHPKNNYLRFQHVNSILNAIARGVYDVCQQLKHEPDGVTREGLEKEIPRYLEKYVASDALVKPRDESQGTEPFVVVVVKQADFDLWDIKIYVCPTGLARRISVEPILFR
ncbi:Ig-like domain-containing protein [Citrobacter portucalensis]|uniref:invasin domain 3-containing protein n=1 Tax=Citrobacter portucalensis TaxID=1639133 RepID=UPI00226B8D81|nr:invasin domain 3-containing protein [Citrobacter portucalensis]MCX8980185.1 Ig-like domain-containing protein [Citrobacter portucalensis]